MRGRCAKNSMSPWKASQLDGLYFGHLALQRPEISGWIFFVGSWWCPGLAPGGTFSNWLQTAIELGDAAGGRQLLKKMILVT